MCVGPVASRNQGLFSRELTARTLVFKDHKVDLHFFNYKATQDGHKGWEQRDFSSKKIKAK